MRMFVFHVDVGTMMTFDTDLMLESVENLKKYLENTFKIPAEHQVLLISGGECLDPNKRLCSYSLGTDTNPIFLFSRSLIDSPNAPVPAVGCGTEEDLQQIYKEYYDLPANLDTVIKRADLARRYWKAAEKISVACDELVRDQHWQQQGWCAVVANLEDLAVDLQKISESFEKDFYEYLTARESYLACITNFNDNLVILEKIPILPALRDIEQQNVASQSTEGTEENTNNIVQCMSSKEMTLLAWISAAGTKESMDQLYEHCFQGVEEFSEVTLNKLKLEVDEILKAADNPNFKEVRGLGERLFGLQTLLSEAKKLVRQQSDSLKTFEKNENSAKQSESASAIPKFCDSHKNQLTLMAHNHKHLSEIRHNCYIAKEELCSNLNKRLKWVKFVEEHISNMIAKILTYHARLVQLRRHLEILRQIHLAPDMYLSAVREVVRRRIYSQSFLLWASELACHLLTIRNEEITRRKEFQAQFEQSALITLFPGMEDLPPNFATQAPPMFDCDLPKISLEDIEKLKERLPELADQLNIPETSALANLLMKSLMKKEEEEVREIQEAEEGKVGQEAVSSSDLLKGTGSEPCLTTAHGLPHLKDLDRGCESETDTEEFEKVGQSPMELHFDKQLSPSRPGTQDASTSTEDNLQISKSEHEKLKSYVVQMHFLTKETTSQFRSDLSNLKAQLLLGKTVVSQQCESLGSSWENLIVERDNKEKELFESIRKEHELIVSGFKRTEQEKNEKIESLLAEKSELEANMLKNCDNFNQLQETLNTMKAETDKKLEELRNQLQEKEIEKERCIKETTDRLNREHTVELQNIRARFKLMTMERSPTETSIESSQYSSLHHSTLIAQMTENFEIDKEKAVKTAIQQENERWEQLLAGKMSELEQKFEQEKEVIVQDAIKRIFEEKDKQIEFLTEREKNLSMECIKYKNTIQQLTETVHESPDSDLIDKINVLQKEKEKLEIELERIKGDRLADLSASVAVVEGRDATTSPIRQKETMSRSEISTGRTGKVNIDSCKSGDIVIVVWDPLHESFQILQDNKHMYFLHSDYLEPLGLEVVDGKPNKFYCTGVVIDKEYCHARKSENRYRVPKGTKFFRVKVQPLTSTATKEVTRSLYHQRSIGVDTSNMSQSHSTISTIKEVVAEDKVDSHSHPPSPIREYSEDANSGLLVSVEKYFAEDSGIVDNVPQNLDNIEQAAAAIDVTLTGDKENIDRCATPSTKVDEQHTYISSTWLEMMISRVFNKSYQNQ